MSATGENGYLNRGSYQINAILVASGNRRVAIASFEFERECAMSRNLTQPEEIDLVLHEMTKNTIEADMKSTDAKPLIKSAQSCWNTGSISPYRAAYMKAHGLVS